MHTIRSTLCIHIVHSVIPYGWIVKQRPTFQTRMPRLLRYCARMSTVTTHELTTVWTWGPPYTLTTVLYGGGPNTLGSGLRSHKTARVQQGQRSGSASDYHQVGRREQRQAMLCCTGAFLSPLEQMGSWHMGEGIGRCPSRGEEREIALQLQPQLH